MAESSEDTRVRDEVRATIHKLNNLLTTVMVQADSILLASPKNGVAGMAQSILDSAADAEEVIRDCRRRVLDDEPEPDFARPVE